MHSLFFIMHTNFIKCTYILYKPRSNCPHNYFSVLQYDILNTHQRNDSLSTHALLTKSLSIHTHTYIKSDSFTKREMTCTSESRLYLTITIDQDAERSGMRARATSRPKGSFVLRVN